MHIAHRAAAKPNKSLSKSPYLTNLADISLNL